MSFKTNVYFKMRVFSEFLKTDIYREKTGLDNQKWKLNPNWNIVYSKLNAIHCRQPKSMVQSTKMNDVQKKKNTHTVSKKNMLIRPNGWNNILHR